MAYSQKVVDKFEETLNNPENVNLTGVCNMTTRKFCTVHKLKPKCATVQHF